MFSLAHLCRQGRRLADLLPRRAKELAMAGLHTIGIDVGHPLGEMGCADRGGLRGQLGGR